MLAVRVTWLTRFIIIHTVSTILCFTLCNTPKEPVDWLSLLTGNRHRDVGLWNKPTAYPGAHDVFRERPRSFVKTF